MSEVVTVHVEDRVATVSLNRPDKLNAMTFEVFAALADAGRAIASDPDVRAVLLRGEGRAFSAGLDLSAFTNLGGGATSPLEVAGRVLGAQEGFAVWPRMAKPVVAAVHGYAFGAGIQLAMAADIRICAEGTQLSVFEVNYGLVPDLGGTHHLPRLVGVAAAKELTWTGRKIDASEAKDLGLVNRVVPADDLEKVASELCRDLASRPPLAVQLGKRLLDDAHELTLEENLRRVADAQATCILSEDIKEAVAAAFEKRPGTFTGR